MHAYIVLMCYTYGVLMILTAFSLPPFRCGYLVPPHQRIR